MIEQIRARAARRGAPGLRLGIGDDCALLRPRAGEDLAVTTDLSIEGQHFRREWYPPEVVGYRTLARGLSDLAAMGARPVAAFLSLGLPRELVRAARGARKSWLERFLDGFFSLAASADTPLAGGDLAEAPFALADIVLIGAVRSGKALLRSGARPGDAIYVTGGLGGATAGLERLMAAWDPAKPPARQWPRQARRMPADVKRLFRPEPRLRQGAWLAARGGVTAMIDLSDGLSTDLAHLCEESGVGAEIDAARLPIYRLADLRLAMHGGDDYELLFTAAPETRLPKAIAGVPVTRIGRITRQGAGRPLMRVITAEGLQPLEARGWEHFA